MSVAMRVRGAAHSPADCRAAGKLV